MNSENKQKLKDEPESTMEELFRRGEVGEFEHLKDIVDYNKVEDNANSKR